MTALDLLRQLQLATFAMVLVAVVVQYRRWPTRPGAYVLAAFAVLMTGLVLARFVVPSGLAPLLGTANLFLLSAFPWLLAAFAWSFAGRLPRWLLVAGLLPVVLGIWPYVQAPFPLPGEVRTTAQGIYLALFSASWAVFSLAAAWHLWSRPGGQHLVRTRTRVMASGLVVLTIALLLAARLGSEPRVVTTVTTCLAILAALLFAAGLAPPQPLRLWWRSRSSRSFRQMQAELLGATTPHEVADAVVRPMAEAIGCGVAVAGRDGDVLATAGMGREEATLLAQRLASGRDLGDEATAEALDHHWLVVRRTPYTPVFGQLELDLMGSLRAQLRLALERTELFVAHRMARAEAERAHAELESALLGLSHDLRSPTAAIAGFVGLLEEIDDPVERAEIVRHVRASTGYLDELVRKLLAWSAVSHAPATAEPVDVAALAGQVATRVRVTHPDARVVVRRPLPRLLADPVRLEQVVDNLVGNAVRHGGRPDVTVVVTGSTGPDGAELVVEDDGAGVAPEDRDRIFALFQRGRGASRDGTGLGLGMSRRIVEALGGSLELDERSPGARFVVRLPADRVVCSDATDGVVDAQPAPMTGRTRPVGLDPTPGVRAVLD